MILSYIERCFSSNWASTFIGLGVGGVGGELLRVDVWRWFGGGGERGKTAKTRL